MSTGIIVCGMNGSGKSTLGRALADALGFHFIDNENLYFARTGANEPYANPRTRAEVEQLLLEEVRQHPDFVFASVKGDYGQAILPMYTHAVLIEVPKAIRMQRIRDRSFGKFGARMLPGGDLHASEEDFFRMVDARPEDFAESWVQSLACPILRINGTKPIAENVKLILSSIQKTDR